VTEPDVDLDALRELDHPRRNFSSWRWFRRNLEEVDVDEPCPFDGDLPTISLWRAHFESRLESTLGRTPAPVPLATEVLDSVDCGSYRRDHIVYDSERFMSVPAYLLVPHDRTSHGPAVLAEVGTGDDRADAIIGRCPAMLDVYKAIGRVAGQDVTVLITGETGTGKELVARALYQHSKRAAGPWRGGPAGARGGRSAGTKRYAGTDMNRSLW